MLARFPGTKWIVHNGWYTYNGANFTGWYFMSIPAQTCLPVTPEDLSHLSIFEQLYSGSLMDYLLMVSKEQTKPQLLLS